MLSFIATSLLFLLFTASTGLESNQSDNSTLCQLCEIVVAWAEDGYIGNATLIELQIFLNKTVCAHLPATDRPLCYWFVDDELPNIYILLIAKENPYVVCQQIDLCSSRDEKLRLKT